MDYLKNITNPKAKANILKLIGKSKDILAKDDAISAKQYKKNRRANYLSLVKQFEKLGTEDEEEINPVDERGKFGMTALHCAIQSGDVLKVNELLESGARLDIKDNAGKTAIDYGYRTGDIEIITSLERSRKKREEVAV